MKKLATAGVVLAALIAVSGCGRSATSQPADNPPVQPVQPAPPAFDLMSLTGGNVPSWLLVKTTAGAECGIQYGGRLVPDSGYNVTDLNLHYTRSPLHINGEDECPDGALVQIPQQQFAAMGPKTAAVDEALQVQYSAMKALPPGLADSSAGTWASPDPYGSTLVRILNLDRFWGECFIDFELGKKKAIGNISGIPLMVYKVSKPTSGGECPSGTMFLNDPLQLTLIPIIYFVS